MSAEQRPEVSVIVRSVGRSSLNAALDSVLAQTYRPIRLVVVAASGAAHAPLPEHWGDLPLQLAVHPQGLALKRPAAANFGLQAAPGPLMLFLDDDDLLLPPHVQRLVDALLAHPTSVAANTGVALGRFVDGQWHSEHNFDAAMDPIRLRFENHLPIHSVLWRRSMLKHGLAFDESFDLFEDWDFWLQLSTLGPWQHVSGVSARYVLAAANAKTGTEEDQSEVFDETPAALEARERLFEKWRLLGSAADHQRLLERLQHLHRELPATQAQARLHETEAKGLRDILAARDADALQWQQMQASLQTVIAAREHEIAQQQRGQQDLQKLVAAREQERSSLQTLLAAREHEIAQAAAHAQALQAVVGSRDAEVDQLKAALHSMQANREHDLTESQRQQHAQQAIVAAREDEIQNLGLALSDHQRLLQARDQDIVQYSLQLSNLQKLVHAREAEIASAVQQIQSLREVLAARETELENRLQHGQAQAEQIASQSSALTALQTKLDLQEQALAQLQAENPLAALRRTLKNSFHG